MHSQGCSSTPLRSLTLMVAAAPRPPLSNLKKNEEIGGEIMLTKGEILIPSLPNECILKDIDLPSSKVCTNSIFMSNQDNIIDEFLEKCVLMMKI